MSTPHYLSLTPDSQWNAVNGSDLGLRKQTVETRVFVAEFESVKSLHHDADNYNPRFSCTDLISAYISLVFALNNPTSLIFAYLHTDMVLRDPNSGRRSEHIWMPQYELLLALQRSPRNRHPNPNFKLDQFTTACIAIALKTGIDKQDVYRQARKNTADRAAWCDRTSLT